MADAATKGLAQATGLLADVRAGKGTVGRLFTDDQFYKDINAFVGVRRGVVTSHQPGQGHASASWSTTPASTRPSRRLLDDLDAITDAAEQGRGQPRRS